MSIPPERFIPTLAPATGSKLLKIPHTKDGIEFVEKLKSLLGVTELPFVQSCPPTAQSTAGAEAHSLPGSTTYALEIRMEQEGWPP